MFLSIDSEMEDDQNRTKYPHEKYPHEIPKHAGDRRQSPLLYTSFYLPLLLLVALISSSYGLHRRALYPYISW